jgi:hypothetical protein
MSEEEKKVTPRRLWQRRWCRPCRDCSVPIVFLDETRPPINGKPRGKWAVCELYPERDGQLLPWDGSIAYSPRDHVLHVCASDRRRLAWIIRKESQDI